MIKEDQPMDTDLVAHIRAQLTDKDPEVRKQGLAQAKALGDWSPVIEGCSLLGSSLRTSKG